MNGKTTKITNLRQKGVALCIEGLGSRIKAHDAEGFTELEGLFKDITGWPETCGTDNPRKQAKQLGRILGKPAFFYTKRLKAFCTSCTLSEPVSIWALALPGDEFNGTIYASLRLSNGKLTLSSPQAFRMPEILRQVHKAIYKTERSTG